VVDLDDAMKQRAEALALEACRELAAAAADFDPPQPTRVQAARAALHARAGW
jgi:hypothetical protein